MGISDYEGLVIIGAGPAGSALAYLARRVFNTNIVVYEALKRPGLKACGWGLLRSVEEYIGNVPRETVLNDIKGFKIFVDDELIVEYTSRRTIAYMIDRPLLMEKLLEQSDAEVFLGRRVSLEGMLEEFKGYLPVIATGFQWRPFKRRLILGIEYRVENAKIDDLDFMEAWTWSGLIGYLWVFPFNEREAHIGVGGVLSYNELKSLLDRFLRENNRFRNARIKYQISGYVTVNGLEKAFLHDNAPVIGEAMGAVLPLTGEGMRPSMISAWSLVKALKRGDWRLYTRFFEKTSIPDSIRLQYKILRHVEGRRARLPVKRLRDLVKDCEWLVYELAFGRMNTWSILKALPCGLRKALIIASMIKRYS